MSMVLANTSVTFCRYSWSEQNRRMLRLLDLHGLARPVKVEGKPVIWTATEKFVSLAGEFTRQAQPQPAHVPFDWSYSAIFERHVMRCIDVVERSFENEYGRKLYSEVDLREVLDAVSIAARADAFYHNSPTARLVGDILTIERQLKVDAAKSGDRVVLEFPIEKK
jgi:hypothetical protein